MKVIPLHFVYPQAWRDAGLPISTNSNECAKLYDAAVSQVLSVRLEQKSRIIFNSAKVLREKDKRSVGCSRFTRLNCFFHPTIWRLLTNGRPLEVFFSLRRCSDYCRCLAGQVMRLLVEPVEQ